MSAASPTDWDSLKRLGRYLLGKPRLVLHFRWQKRPSEIRVLIDSDWAGCVNTRKSTSGVYCLEGTFSMSLLLRQVMVDAQEAGGQVASDSRTINGACGERAYPRPYLRYACCARSLCRPPLQQGCVGKYRLPIVLAVPT